MAIATIAERHTAAPELPRCTGNDRCASDNRSSGTTTAAPETTTTAAPAPSIGTADNPIEVLFVPSVSAEEIIAGGDLLKAALNEATGLEFNVSVGTSYASTIEEMCASPENTIGFIPAQGYVLASDLCGVEMAAQVAAVRLHRVLDPVHRASRQRRQ